MKYCVNCGSIMEEEQRFCSVCGAQRIPQELPTEAPVAVQQPPQLSNPETLLSAETPVGNKKSKKKLLVIIGAAFAVLCLAAVLVWLIFSPKEKEVELFSDADAFVYNDEGEILWAYYYSDDGTLDRVGYRTEEDGYEVRCSFVPSGYHSSHIYLRDTDGNIIADINDDGDYTRYERQGDKEIRTVYDQGDIDSYSIWYYDDDGNAVSITEYDMNGMLSNQIKRAYDKSGNIVRSQGIYASGGAYYSEYTYDKKGRPLTTTSYSEYGTTKMSYTYDKDGNEISQEYTSISEGEEYVSISTKTYDPAGRLLSVETSSEGLEKTVCSLTEYQYPNENEKIVRLYEDDVLVSETVFRYAEDGRLEEAVKKNEEGIVIGRAEYQYEANGLLIEYRYYSENDFLEEKLCFEVMQDLYVRNVETMTYSDYSEEYSNFSWVYDQSGRLISRTTSDSDYYSGYTFRYDDTGLLDKIEYESTYSEDSIRILYDEDFRVKRVTISGEYDSNKRSYQYSEDGQVKTYLFGYLAYGHYNGCANCYYDADDRLEEIVGFNAYEDLCFETNYEYRKGSDQIKYIGYLEYEYDGGSKHETVMEVYFDSSGRLTDLCIEKPQDEDSDQSYRFEYSEDGWLTCVEASDGDEEWTAFYDETIGCLVRQ